MFWPGNHVKPDKQCQQYSARRRMDKVISLYPWCLKMAKKLLDSLNFLFSYPTELYNHASSARFTQPGRRWRSWSGLLSLFWVFVDNAWCTDTPKTFIWSCHLNNIFLFCFRGCVEEQKRHWHCLRLDHHPWDAVEILAGGEYQDLIIFLSKHLLLYFLFSEEN